MHAMAQHELAQRQLSAPLPSSFPSFSGSVELPRDPRLRTDDNVHSYELPDSAPHEMMASQVLDGSSASFMQPLPPSSDWTKLQQRVSDLRVALSRSCAISEDLRQQVAGLTESLQDKHAENAYLHTQFAQATDELQLLLGQVHGHAHNTQAMLMQRMQDDLTTSVQQRLALEGEVQQLQFELHASSVHSSAEMAAERDERRRLAAELGQVRLLLASRQRHLDCVQSQLEQSHHDAQQTAAQLDQTQQEAATTAAAAEQAVAQANEQVAAAAGVAEQLLAQVEQLQQQLEQREQAIAAQKQQLSELHVQREWLEAAVSDLGDGRITPEGLVQLHQELRQGGAEAVAAAEAARAECQKWQQRALQAEQLLQERERQVKEQAEVLGGSAGAEGLHAGGAVAGEQGERVGWLEGQLQHALEQLEQLRLEHEQHLQQQVMVAKHGSSTRADKAAATPGRGGGAQSAWQQALACSDDDDTLPVSDALPAAGTARCQDMLHGAAPPEAQPCVLAEAGVQTDVTSETWESPGRSRARASLLTAAHEELAQLRTANAQLAQEAADARRGMVCMDDVVRALEEARTLSRTKLEQALSASAARWTDRTSELTRELEEARSELSTLARELDSAKAAAGKEAKEAERGRVAMDAERRTWQEAKQQLSAELASAQLDLSRTRTELDDVRVQLQDKQARLVACEERLQRMLTENNHTMKQVRQDHESELAMAMLDAAARARQQLQRLEEQLNQQDLQLNQLKDQLQHKEQQLMETHTSLTDLQQQQQQRAGFALVTIGCQTDVLLGEVWDRAIMCEAGVQVGDGDESTLYGVDANAELASGQGYWCRRSHCMVDVGVQAVAQGVMVDVGSQCDVAVMCVASVQHGAPLGALRDKGSQMDTRVDVDVRVMQHQVGCQTMDPTSTTITAAQATQTLAGDVAGVPVCVKPAVACSTQTDDLPPSRSSHAAVCFETAGTDHHSGGMDASPHGLVPAMPHSARPSQVLHEPCGTAAAALRRSQGALALQQLQALRSSLQAGILGSMRAQAGNAAGNVATGQGHRGSVGGSAGAGSSIGSHTVSGWDRSLPVGGVEEVESSGSVVAAPISFTGNSAALVLPAVQSMASTNGTAPSASARRSIADHLAAGHDGNSDGQPRVKASLDAPWGRKCDQSMVQARQDPCEDLKLPYNRKCVPMLVLLPPGETTESQEFNMLPSPPPAVRTSSNHQHQPSSLPPSPQVTTSPTLPSTSASSPLGPIAPHPITWLAPPAEAIAARRRSPHRAGPATAHTGEVGPKPAAPYPLPPPPQQWRVPAHEVPSEAKGRGGVGGEEWGEEVPGAIEAHARRRSTCSWVCGAGWGSESEDTHELSYESQLQAQQQRSVQQHDDNGTAITGSQAPQGPGSRPTSLPVGYDRAVQTPRPPRSQDADYPARQQPASNHSNHLIPTINQLASKVRHSGVSSPGKQVTEVQGRDVSLLPDQGRALYGNRPSLPMLAPARASGLRDTCIRDVGGDDAVYREAMQVQQEAIQHATHSRYGRLTRSSAGVGLNGVGLREGRSDVDGWDCVVDGRQQPSSGMECLVQDVLKQLTLSRLHVERSHAQETAAAKAATAAAAAAPRVTLPQLPAPEPQLRALQAPVTSASTAMKMRQGSTVHASPGGHTGGSVPLQLPELVPSRRLTVESKASHRSRPGEGEGEGQERGSPGWVASRGVPQRMLVEQKKPTGAAVVPGRRGSKGGSSPGGQGMVHGIGWMGRTSAGSGVGEGRRGVSTSSDVGAHKTGMQQVQVQGGTGTASNRPVVTVSLKSLGELGVWARDGLPASLGGAVNRRYMSDA